MLDSPYAEEGYRLFYSLNHRGWNNGAQLVSYIYLYWYSSDTNSALKECFLYNLKQFQFDKKVCYNFLRTLFTLSYATDGSFAYIDEGDIPLYAKMMIQTINDMANAPDSATQATAVVQTIATIGELANGIPGDACEAAAVCIKY